MKNNRDLRFWDYLPDFAVNFSMEQKLDQIENLEREILETESANRRRISELEKEIENRIASEYTAEEIREAKSRAAGYKYCVCGEDINCRYEFCPNCRRRWFPKSKELPKH